MIDIGAPPGIKRRPGKRGRPRATSLKQVRVHRFHTPAQYRRWLDDPPVTDLEDVARVRAILATLGEAVERLAPRHRGRVSYTRLGARAGVAGHAARETLKGNLPMTLDILVRLAAACGYRVDLVEHGQPGTDHSADGSAGAAEAPTRARKPRRLYRVRRGETGS